MIDDQVEPLLDGIEPESWACLVFASNSTVSAEVDAALVRRHDDLHRYIGAGGGVVVLHQIRESLEPILPEDELPKLTERASPSGAILDADDELDILLHYPLPVAWRTLRDIPESEIKELRKQGHPSELSRVFFTFLDRASLPHDLKPVLATAGQEVVLARTREHTLGRVVLSTIPLDWQGGRPGQADASVALLANAIHYAFRGSPRRLVWHAERGYRNELLLRWLAGDGAAAVRPVPGKKDPLDATTDWLLSRVDVCLLPSGRFDDVVKREAIKEFLTRGGVLATSAFDNGLPASRIHALVGRHEERTLASRLYTELRAIDGWQNAAHAFELRNIVSALAYLEREEAELAEAVAFGPAEVAHLADDIRGRLAQAGHREDLGSSIALAETLAHLEPSRRLRVTDFDWIRDEASRRPFDIRLQIRAVLGLGGCEDVSDFLADAARELEVHSDEFRSPAQAVRVLDAVAKLDQAHLLPDDVPHAVATAELVCKVLSRFPPLPDRGWLSLEATADVTRGLIALYKGVKEIPDSAPDAIERILANVAIGASALRPACSRPINGPKGVARLARLVHAIIVAERHFPIGLQRLATLEWPDKPLEGGGETAERSRLEQLAVQNDRLRDNERELQEQIDTTRVKLDDQRLAAQVGRAAATILPAASFAALYVWILLEFAPWQTVLLNVGIIVAGLATLFGLLFSALKRLGLLARPADRLLEGARTLGSAATDLIKAQKQ